MDNIMQFPETFEEFAKSYGFKDSKEIYTNGSELIPVFRVEQWLEHARAERTCRNLFKQVDDNGKTPIDNGICFVCSECDAYVRDAEGYHSGLYPDYCDTGFKYDIAFSYCPNCGAKVVEK